MTTLLLLIIYFAFISLGLLDSMIGAGDSRLDLSKLDLTAFSIDTGAGDLDLDLRGSWARDIPVKLRTGSGDIAIRLPATIGVRVDVSTGAGDITQTGLQMDGGDYVNADYGQSPFTLNLTIETGSGDIILEGSRSSNRRSLPDRI